MSVAIESSLIEYIRRTFDIDVKPLTPLIANGVIDSMGVMELVTFVGKTFAVEFDMDDMTVEKLGTVSAIAALVVTKRNGSCE